MIITCQSCHVRRRIKDESELASGCIVCKEKTEKSILQERRRLGGPIIRSHLCKKCGYEGKVIRKKQQGKCAKCKFRIY